MIELVGIFGMVCFSICGIPEAYISWRRKRSNVTLGFLLLWLIGEVCTAYYVLYTSADWILLCNYLVNFICILIIGRYKLWPSA